jgi:hypothetical protein
VQGLEITVQVNAGTWPKFWLKDGKSYCCCGWLIQLTGEADPISEEAWERAEAHSQYHQYKSKLILILKSTPRSPSACAQRWRKKSARAMAQKLHV